MVDGVGRVDVFAGEAGNLDGFGINAALGFDRRDTGAAEPAVLLPIDVVVRKQKEELL